MVVPKFWFIFQARHPPNIESYKFNASHELSSYLIESCKALMSYMLLIIINHICFTIMILQC